MISENGCALEDIVEDGKVHDPIRTEFLNNYLSSLKKAIDDGIDVFGYMQWSFIDNFEWAEGYNPRFGMIYCDYDNGQKRIIKDSAWQYKKIIETNGENLNESSMDRQSLVKVL